MIFLSFFRSRTLEKTKSPLSPAWYVFPVGFYKKCHKINLEYELLVLNSTKVIEFTTVFPGIKRSDLAGAVYEESFTVRQH